ncbi:MAG: TonB-dependent receptor [Polyangiaceae bacterium]
MRRALSAAPIAAALALSRLASADDEPGAEVFVAGERLGHGDDPTGATAELAPADLDDPGASLVDALAGAPGVAVSRTGGAAELATITLRGATSAETPIYLGPILLNDEITGTADLSLVPPAFIRRVLIERGHAPLELEQGGLAGAVVLEPFVPSGLHARVGFGGGSFGERYLFSSVSAGDDRASAVVAARLDALDADFSYVDDQGTAFDPSDDVERRRQNADASSVGAFTAVSATHGRAHVTAFLLALAREQGAPGLGVLPAEHARARSSRVLGGAEADLDCASRAVASCVVHVETWGRTSSYALDDPYHELPFGFERQLTRASGAGTRFFARVAPARFLELTGGASLAEDSLSVRVPGTRASRTSLRLFTSAVARVAPWVEVRAEGAIAGDFVRGPDPDTGALATTASPTPTARLALAARPIPELELFTGVARYARTPVLGELYGAALALLGNPRLASEAGYAGDVGARATARAPHVVFAAELDAFARFASELIAYRRSSFGALTPFNVGEARVLGVDGTIATTVFDVLFASTTLSFTDARDTTAGRTLENDTLPFVSRVVSRSTLGARARDLVPAIGLDLAEVSASFTYRSPRQVDPAGLVSLPSQVLFDVEASLSLARGLVLVRGRVSNILDDRTTDLVGYPLPGRAGHFETEVRW